MNKETKITATTTIAASSQEVWAVLSNFGDISNFHPLVSESRLTNDLQGLGSTRHCALLPMGVMEEKVIQWEEGVSFTAEVFDGKMLPPCHYMKGHIHLQPLDKRTVVTFNFTYCMKFGLLGRLMNVLLIKPQFKKAPPKYVGGLKAYIESASSKRE